MGDEIDQEEGNFNVFCQSCGRIIAVNIDSNQEALELENKHTKGSDCKYTGTHIIKE
jgi:Fe2+ or Zn2+ uptake regulation protein